MDDAGSGIRYPPRTAIEDKAEKDPHCSSYKGVLLHEESIAVTSEKAGMSQDSTIPGLETTR